MMCYLCKLLIEIERREIYEILKNHIMQLPWLVAYFPLFVECVSGLGAQVASWYSGVFQSIYHKSRIPIKSRVKPSEIRIYGHFEFGSIMEQISLFKFVLQLKTSNRQVC